MDYDEDKLAKFKSYDGSELDIHIWSAENPKAIFAAIHGGMAHGGDYVNVGKYFQDKGITTISYDLRGHKRKRVKIDRFNDFVEDTDYFIQWIFKNYPELPVFLVAHSMGCNIVTNYLIEKGPKDPRIKGTIFSSPYYGNAIKIPGIMKALSSVLSALIPNSKLPAEDFTPHLTHDAKIYDRHREDEKKNIRASEPSMRFGAELLKNQKWISKNIQRMDEDLLVLISGDDMLCDVDVTKNLLSKLDNTKVKQVLYEQNYHENFNENNRNEIFNEIETWISKFL